MAENCRRVRDELDAYAVGLAEASDIDQKHLGDCPECASAFWKAGTLRRELDEYSRGIEAALGEEVEARLLGQMKRPRPPAAAERRMLGRPVAVGVAAALALAVGLGVLLDPLSPYSPGRKRTATAEQAAGIVEALQREKDRRQVVDYLDRSELVLFALLDGDRRCREDDKVRIDRERELARQLLFERRLLDASLSEPEKVDLKRLCDELEFLLLQVASSDNCIRPERIQEWRRILESRSTLLRLNLLRREAAA